MLERPKLKLHEAMEQVLTERGNSPRSARELADDINNRRLYWQRTGGEVPPGQISARLNKYKHLFRRTPDGDIQLKRDP